MIRFLSLSGAKVGKGKWNIVMEISIFISILSLSISETFCCVKYWIRHSCFPMTSFFWLEYFLSLSKFNQFSCQKATENPLETLISVGQYFEKHDRWFSNVRFIFCVIIQDHLCHAAGLSLPYFFLAEILKNQFTNILENYPRTSCFSFELWCILYVRKNSY